MRRKRIALLLAAVMIFSNSTATAFAESGDDPATTISSETTLVEEGDVSTNPGDGEGTQPEAPGTETPEPTETSANRQILCPAWPNQADPGRFEQPQSSDRSILSRNRTYFLSI